MLKLCPTIKSRLTKDRKRRERNLWWESREGLVTWRVHPLTGQVRKWDGFRTSLPKWTAIANRVYCLPCCSQSSRHHCIRTMSLVLMEPYEQAVDKNLQMHMKPSSSKETSAASIIGSSYPRLIQPPPLPMATRNLSRLWPHFPPLHWSTLVNSFPAGPTKPKASLANCGITSNSWSTQPKSRVADGNFDSETDRSREELRWSATDGGVTHTPANHIRSI